MTPFTILHVCMGNICRSPMAERLTVLAARDLLSDAADEALYVHSAGTGGWHAGERMDAPAARQVRARGGEAETFRARKLRAEHLDGSDLVLTATLDQQEYAGSLRPDAAPRIFVLGEFGRLLRGVVPAAGGVVPAGGVLAAGGRSAAAELSPEVVHGRGAALVAALDAARDGRPARAGDELDDPWGRGDGYFSRVADEIEATVRPLVAALLGEP